MLVAWAYGTWASNVTSLLVCSRLQDSSAVVQQKVMRNTRGSTAPSRSRESYFRLTYFIFWAALLSESLDQATS